jgi:zinc protease
MKALAAAILAAGVAFGATETPVIALPSKSPLVTFRITFRTGAAHDPAGKPGAAALTAAMLSQGGTKDLTYKQVVDALFPMATSVSSQVDKEMTTFSATTHADNLETFYKLFSSILLNPGWRPEDLSRLRDDAINYLRVSLRGNNDEELGKEVLYNMIYEGHPYGWHNLGTVSSLQKLTMEDLKEFYATHYNRSNLIIGLAGGYPADFAARVKKDFEKLPQGQRSKFLLPRPKAIEQSQMLIVDKHTRSTAYSIGFPIEVNRSHRDYPALLVGQSYFGQHRNSGGRLYEQMREIRGLNYGDYAYIEYFPNGMFQFEPDPNLARRQQIFQIWIRPVEPPTAHFALRLTLFELDRLIKIGLNQEEFERTRSFLSKYVNLLMKTKSSELGYAIDSLFYGTINYRRYLNDALSRLTVDDVNRAIRKHLHADRLRIVAITDNAEELKKKIVAETPSSMTYNSPKSDEVLKEDKIVENWKLNLKAGQVRIVPVATVFE